MFAAEERAVGAAERRLRPARRGPLGAVGAVAAAAVLEVDVVREPVRRAEGRAPRPRPGARVAVCRVAIAAQRAAEDVLEVYVGGAAVLGAVEQAALRCECVDRTMRTGMRFTWGIDVEVDS